MSYVLEKSRLCVVGETEGGRTPCHQGRGEAKPGCMQGRWQGRHPAPAMQWGGGRGGASVHPVGVSPSLGHEGPVGRLSTSQGWFWQLAVLPRVLLVFCELCRCAASVDHGPLSEDVVGLWS